MNRFVLPVIFLLVGVAALPAQEKPSRRFDSVVKYEVRIDPPTAKPGETVTWKFTMEIAPGFHTYPTYQKDPKAQSYKTALRFPDPAKNAKAPRDAIFVGQLSEPSPVSEVKPEYELLVFHNKVIWERPLVVSPKAEPGEKTIRVPVNVQVCDDIGCLPGPNALEAKLTITNGTPMPIEEKYKEEVERALAGPPIKPTIDKPLVKDTPTPGADKPRALIAAPTTADYQKTMDEIRARLIPPPAEQQGLLMFMFIGALFGWASLVTPCVFPMIPITVSYFLKQAQKQHQIPIIHALVYCSTVVVVLTISAIVLLSFFVWLSINPLMNLALGALFIFFALSLFGMYEIELPSFLARFTSAREGKGGLVGTVFMALTFTIISFACVAPFLGGFGGTASIARLGLLKVVLGALAFSVAFASPFFVMAMFPSLLKLMPKSGNWLNNVKVVMGFIELAAAFKFLRLAEMVVSPQGTPAFLTYDLVLGVWVALSLLCGLYLIGVFRLPHDTPTEHLSVPRLLFALAFLGLGLYLMPALFKFGNYGEKQRPEGVVYAWIDSFILPEPRLSHDELPWSPDLRQALDDAFAEQQKTGKPSYVFIDFTGETCTNCRANENSTFKKPEVRGLLRQYHLVQLYTDYVPDNFYTPEVRATFESTRERQERDASDVNLSFQDKAIGTVQRPLYVILEPLPDGKVKVHKPYAEAKINDETGFKKYLQDPLMAAGK